MNKLSMIFLVGLILLASGVQALEQEGGGGLILGKPTGDFGEAMDNVGFGLELNYGIRPVPSLTFGVGGNFMICGSESRQYSLPLVEDFNVNTTNNLAGGFLYTQWRPLSGVVQPYAEGRVGVNYLWTESKIEDQDWWDDDEVARETNFDDFAGYYGGGGGVLIRVAENTGDTQGTNVYLDLKVSYLKGSKAEYLTEGDIEIVNNQPVYSVTESETDLLVYKMGVVLTF